MRKRGKCREKKRDEARNEMTSIKFTRRGEVCIFATLFFTFSSTMKGGRIFEDVTREILFLLYLFTHLKKLLSGIPMETLRVEKKRSKL